MAFQITDTELSLFADDAALLARNANLRHAMQKHQRHTSLLEQCSTKWRISINLDKTTATIFTLRSHMHIPESRIFYHSAIPWSRKVA
jgi:hypothetical protein